MFITIEVDDEEYPVPADGRVGEELEDSLQEYFYDIDGANIKHIKNNYGVRYDKQPITNRLPKLYSTVTLCTLERR